jgi:oligoendopeptidase F
MSLPERDEIDPEYRFDLTTIYETPDDWTAAARELDDELDALEASAADPLETTDDLRALLQAIEECYRRKQRLKLYVNLANAVGRDDAPRWERYHDLESTHEEHVATALARLGDDGTLEGLAAELDDNQWYVENLRERARHVRSPEVEETMAAVAETRRAPTEVLHAVRRDLESSVLERPDGERVEIPGADFRTELARPDREYRRRVYDAMWEAFERFEETITEAFAAKLAAVSAGASVRGYASIRDRDLRRRCVPDSGMQSVLPEAVHDAMLDGIRENLGPYHRLLERRRDRLGVGVLRPWDLDVPLAERDPPAVGYEDAKAHILGALEPLGADYVERVRSLFERRRIDAAPGVDKTGKWYCQYSADDGPFVVANYRGDVRSLFVLCHELGHAMHVEHHREGPVRYATSPQPVSEVPSTVHQLLLADHLVGEGGALADAALERVLVQVGRSLYRSAMFAAFVHELASSVERGEPVGPDDARETQRSVLREFREPVELDADAGRTWLGRGTRDPYHNYQYVLGATGGLVVRERLRDGDLTAAEYREFLRSTGRERSVVLFERLGCDVTAPEPYERAATAFDEYVEMAADQEGRHTP